jgi:hypothetical protein
MPKVKQLAEVILRIRGHLRLHLSWASYSENALPIRLLPNTKIVE